MARPIVKSVAAAGIAAGLVLCTAGSAYPAGRPVAAHAVSKPKPLLPVILYDRGILMAQGLTPKAALARARRYVPYAMTTSYYVPKGFRLAIITVYPYIPGTQEPQDTQTFMKLSVRPTTGGKKGQSVAVPSFEVDHQFGQPYTYLTDFALSTVTLGRHRVTVAEQIGRQYKTHKIIDLCNVYWYDSKAKVATEVTAELSSAGLTRAILLRIAASVH